MPDDDAVGGLVLLDLDDPLARAGQVRQRRGAWRRRRRDRATRSGRASRAPRRGRRVEGESRKPLARRARARRGARASGRCQTGSPSQRRTSKATNCGRDLGREPPDPRLGRVEPHLHRVEVERAVAHDHDLAVERRARRQELAERRAARGSSAAAAARCATRAPARRRGSRARRGTRPTSARTAQPSPTGSSRTSSASIGGNGSVGARAHPKPTVKLRRR